MLIPFSWGLKIGPNLLITLLFSPSGVGFQASLPPAQLKTPCCSRATFSYDSVSCRSKNIPCRCLLLITGMLLFLGCLARADQQRYSIKAKAISAGQRGLEDGQAALEARQQCRQEEWGAQGMGCTQQAQVSPGVTEASGPQEHQCQAGRQSVPASAGKGENAQTIHSVVGLLFSCNACCRWGRESSDLLPSQWHPPCLRWSR